MKKISKINQFGAASIIIGTATGGSMLGIPFVLAPIGFNYSIVVLFFAWIIMYSTTLLILEINFSKSLGYNINLITNDMLGKYYKILNIFIYLLLLYSLLTSYISIGSKMFENYIFNFLNISNFNLSKILFCIILGILIYKDKLILFSINGLFLILKLGSFILFVVYVAPFVNISMLDSKYFGSNYILSAIPVLITALSFHIIIPTIREYFNNDIVFKNAVLIGSLIPLIVYLIWIFVTLGVLNLYGYNGFIMLNKSGKTIIEGYRYLGKNSLLFFIKIFEILAVITSFFGISLSLLSFNKDLYSLNVKSKKINIIITLLPPLIFSMFIVNNFIVILGYASIFISILLIIQPVIMVWIIREKQKINTIFSKIYLLIILFIGIGIIILQLFLSFGKLPSI